MPIVMIELDQLDRLAMASNSRKRSPLSPTMQISLVSKNKSCETSKSVHCRQRYFLQLDFRVVLAGLLLVGVLP